MKPPPGSCKSAWKEAKVNNRKTSRGCKIIPFAQPIQQSPVIAYKSARYRRKYHVCRIRRHQSLPLHKGGFGAYESFGPFDKLTFSVLFTNLLPGPCLAPWGEVPPAGGGEGKNGCFYRKILRFSLSVSFADSSPRGRAKGRAED